MAADQRPMSAAAPASAPRAADPQPSRAAVAAPLATATFALG